MQRPGENNLQQLSSDAYMTIGYGKARPSAEPKSRPDGGSSKVAQICKGQLCILDSRLLFRGTDLATGDRVKSIIPVKDLTEIAYGSVPRWPSTSDVGPLRVKFRTSDREYVAQFWINRHGQRSSADGIVWFEALSRLMGLRWRR